MQDAQNSSVHRNGHLLYDNISGGVERVNRSSSEYFSGSQRRETKDTGEHTYSDFTTTVMAPMPAPGRDSYMFYSTDQTVPAYYTNHTAPPPMYNSHPQELSSHYPTASSGFVAAVHGPTMVTPQCLGIAMDFGEMFYEPVTYPLPIPPTSPEYPVLPSPTVYLCRWLGGPPCDGRAPGKNREMGEHLRVIHQFIGHEREKVRCEWGDCGQVLQRMNLPRHIVSRHLLAAASCRFCSREFSRPDVASRHERTCGRVLPL